MSDHGSDEARDHEATDGSGLEYGTTTGATPEESTRSVGLYGSGGTRETQRSALTAGRVPVAVYGLGKMGLPLAAVFADVTGNVIGVDVDESVVASVNAGDCHVAREPGLPELVAEVVERNALRAVADPKAGALQGRLHVVMVPTLLNDDDEPDLSVLEAVARDVGSGLSAGDQVIVESTVPPGTCRDVVLPILLAESGLSVGEFGIACCPERTVSGQALADIRGTHPKIVGGIDEESARVARLVYDQITENDVIVVEDATTAEAVKVFEGVYRDVNIGLANQLALYAGAMDIDVNAAIEAANTQPFCSIHDPGAGVGGHCIPVYPYFLINGFGVFAPLLTAARDINDSMPAHTVDLLRAVLGGNGVGLEDARVLLVGVTYKENVAELRNAPSIEVANLLNQAGAEVLAVDPLVDDFSPFDGVQTVAFEDLPDPSVDAVLLLTPHDEVRGLDWAGFEAPIVDGRQALDPAEIDAPVYAVGGRRP